MILLSHPTGNVFVRALLGGLVDSALLSTFHTSVGFERKNQFIAHLPAKLQESLSRRIYDLPEKQLVIHPAKELIRLLAMELGWDFITSHEHGWASIDAVYRDLDAQVAGQLKRGTAGGAGILTGVYAYEDAAASTFSAAQARGLKRFYELPIAYWQTSRQLLLEEAQRFPEWEQTLGSTRDSPDKLARKTEELKLADVVICPSKFVLSTLPANIRQEKPCLVAEFGSPTIGEVKPERTSGPLRLLFAGSMSQRKGLADLMAALTALNRKDVELVVMGSPLAPMEFYRRQLPSFIYEPPRPHQAVLQLMHSCDALVLPSIVEGRALVQQEAMSCGLPIIITPNTGGEDLIDEGQTGFLVPIRRPDILAEKINWLAEHRSQLPEMGLLAQRKAAQVSWANYRQTVLQSIKSNI